MDRSEQELQYLGFFGIFKESFKIIFSKKKIFSLITVSFIFPLSLIYIINFVYSQYLFFNLLYDEHHVYNSRKTPYHRESAHYLSIEWLTFLLFKVGYFIACLVLSLLSTAAVVYTVACMYTVNDVTFKKVMGVVPKVWKRLVITFIWSVGMLFLFNLASFFIFFILFALTTGKFLLTLIFGIVLLVLYLIGFVYLSMVWQLANVVSMLEECYGRQAMRKAKDLLQGKKKLAVGIFLVLSIVFLGLHVWFMLLLGGMTVLALIVGVLFLLLLLMAILLGHVTETLLYLVCKSHHGENINRSLLAGHLDVIHLGRPVFDAKGGHIELGDQVRV